MSLPHKLSKREYQPRFCKTEGLEIPSVESFRLDNILNTTLKDESQQVIDQLVNVSSKYQADLKAEIKRSLAIEQSIQIKNIKIAKLASGLNRSINSKRKKIVKAARSGGGDENTIDSEIKQLAKVTVDASEIARGLGAKMLQIDRKLGGTDKHLQKYPLMSKMMGIKSEMERREEREEREERIRKEREESVRKEREERIREEKEERERKERETAEGRTIVRTISPEPKKAQSAQSQSQSSPEIKPEEFEAFLSSTIHRFRQVQNKKYEAYDPFKELEQECKTQATSIPPNNPLGLLYSSLITGPTAPANHLSANHPFAAMIAPKSPATIKSTLLTSHYKKLRINGAPITSETFRKQKEAEAISHTQQSTNTSQESTNTPQESTSNTTQESTSDTILPESSSDSSSPGALTPAKKALTESLMVIDNLRLSSDDDTWGSSGLNTETDDDDTEVADPLVSSSSSETESDSLESAEPSAHIASTNQYYQRFTKQLRKKTQKSHRTKGSRRAFEPELSPTPKHQPSHHKLKPKRLILKPARTAARAPTGAPREAREAREATFKLDEYSDERSGLAALNNAYDNRTKYEINNVTAAGTILSSDTHQDVVDDDDTHSIRSITRLKDVISR